MVIQDAAGDLAADDVLAVGRIDHRPLFPRAAAVVHHGGAGTTHAAVAAGMPSIVIPHVGDQPFWAMRLHRLGAAPAPLAATDVSADEVAARIAVATGEPMRRTAEALGQALRMEDGLGTAVSLLEGA
jgi:sterol 3beta-glucosyltransferase